MQFTSTLTFLIWAAAIGICCAIVYSNVTRGVVSIVISALIENNCFSLDSSKSLKELGMKGYQAKIVSYSIKTQYGLKRIIGTKTGNPLEENEMNVFSKKENYETLYYITEEDTDEILKKYSFKTMSLKYVLIFITSLLIATFLFSSFTSWMYRRLTIPKIEQTEEVSKPVNDDYYKEQETENTNDRFDYENGSDDTETESINTPPSVPSTPSIPTAPNIPTLPTS